MKWTETFRNLRREWRDATNVKSMPRGLREIMVYSEDVASYNQLHGYLDAVMEDHSRSIVYVTSAPHDPLFNSHHPRMSVYYVNRFLSGFLPRVDSDIFITTMPDLGNFHLARPAKPSLCLYLFHSLNSIHEVYREGAFDHYDAFFCTGPHHRRELETHFTTYNLPQPTLYDVGYYKLDRVFFAHLAYTKQYADTTVLLAPSWGRGNLLEAHGLEILERLLTLGVRVVVRPHPCFFQSLYPEGRGIVDEIESRFSDHTQVVIERSIVDEDSFHEADLLISDFSGASFEYAFGTLRPVLFVDVARKTKNANWQRLGLPTFEDTMRREVGQVVPAGEVSRIDRYADELLTGRHLWKEPLQELRNSAVFNFGHSAQAGADVINDLLSRKGPAPEQQSAS